MKKNSLFKIKNPELFQGEKYLNNKKDYFEGWYFKNISIDNGISFIPGISINNGKKCCFIQIITNDKSYYVNYDISDFKYGDEPFYIKIEKNYFSKDKLHIDIKGREQDLIIYGDINYFDSINIDTSSFSPNVMGPFSYIPFMECNHAILSMKCNITGYININNKKISFNNGIGYIEKDYGCSFPNKYIWIQGNNFDNENVSFMCSIANIPFLLFNFRGLICSLIIDGCEYRFATYNNSKIIKYGVNDDKINITLKKGDYFLYIEAIDCDGLKLVAPVKGEMNRDIKESISAVIKIELRKKDKIIYSGTSKNCGFEVVD